MGQQSEPVKEPAEQVIKEIRRATRRQFSAEEKIRIVLSGLRGEDSIAELCRREGIVQNLYYRWSKEFLEAGKKRLAGDTARAATPQGTAAPSCCIGRWVGRLGVSWCGGEPSIARGAARYAVQSECRSAPSHPQAAVPGDQLGRVRCRPARSRQPDRLVHTGGGRGLGGSATHQPGWAA